MKIAIPVDDNMAQAKVCISFGRTPYFLIFDTDTKESVFLDNSAAASQGGAGIKAAQAIADNGVTALITPRCGENAAAVLTPANIKIYKTINDSVEDNINAFVEGKLNILDNIHPGFHNHGGSAK